MKDQKNQHNKLVGILDVVQEWFRYGFRQIKREFIEIALEFFKQVRDGGSNRFITEDLSSEVKWERERPKKRWLIYVEGSCKEEYAED